MTLSMNMAVFGKHDIIKRVNIVVTPSGPKYLQQIFFCATHIGHVGFVPELGWQFRSIIL